MLAKQVKLEVRSAKEQARDGGFFFRKAQGLKRKRKNLNVISFERGWTAGLFCENGRTLLQREQANRYLGFRSIGSGSNGWDQTGDPI